MFDIHMSGHGNTVSVYSSSVDKNGKVRQHVSNEKGLVINDGSEISVAFLPNGYKVVMFAGIVYSAMLVDDMDFGMHACSRNTGYDVGHDSYEKLISDNELPVYEAIDIDRLDVDEELLETIYKEYREMILLGGYNDTPQDVIDARLEEIEKYLEQI